MNKYTYRECSSKNDDTPQKHQRRYAEAFVIPQKYENLFSLSEAINIGTIFKDLYIPYDENSKKTKKTCAR